ncbi:hypothetical protein V8C37DRAFT_395517 [Trichoderma ceciliae]
MRFPASMVVVRAEVFLALFRPILWHLFGDGFAKLEAPAAGRFALLLCLGCASLRFLAQDPRTNQAAENFQGSFWIQ